MPEILEPRPVLPQLRTQRLAGSAPERVVLPRLHRQTQQLAVFFEAEHAPGKVVLVPRGHDDDDLSPGAKARFDGVLPLLPEPVAVGLAVGLHAVFHRVVDDYERGRVAGYPGHYAAAYEAAPVRLELKFLGAVHLADPYAEQLLPQRAYLLLVSPAEALGKVGVVARDDNARLGVGAHVPAGQRLGHGHALSVLGRGLDDEDVVGVAGVPLYKALHTLRDEVGHARPPPHRPVDLCEIVAV